MAAEKRRKNNFYSLRSSTVAIVILAGLALGALLALGAAPLIRDFCSSQPACQQQVSALIGGFALAQAIQIVVVYLLVDRLNRQSEERILRALGHDLGDANRVKS